MNSGKGKTMTYLYRLAAKATFLGAAILLSGCSDGGDSAGIEGTGDILASTGSVTAFGSVWVNGIRFDTENTTVLVGDTVASEDDIQPGMVVQISGSTDATGHAYARTIVLDHRIRGPITGIIQLGVPYSEIQVLGQTVIVPEDVALEDVTIGSLSVGQNIVVSGLTQSDGRILATRIDPIQTTLSVDVEGVVQSVDGMQYRLTLGALEVDYSNALLEEITGAPVPGQRLEIEGILAPGPSAVLTASRVRLKEEVGHVVPGSRLAREGVIEHFVSPHSFMLQGLRVEASNSTFTRGRVDQLGNGVRVIAQGRVNAEGVLLANKIELLLPSETRFSGTVESTAPQSRQLTVLGTTFNSDLLTAFEDLSPQYNRRIGLSDINRGDSVEVFGRFIDNQWVATRIRRRDGTGDLSEFRGPVGEILSDTTLLVMGVMVDVSTATGAELVTELRPGDFVKVEGMQTGERAVSATRIARRDNSDCPAPVAVACEAKPASESAEKGVRR